LGIRLECAGGTHDFWVAEQLEAAADWTARAINAELECLFDHFFHNMTELAAERVVPAWPTYSQLMEKNVWPADLDTITLQRALNATVGMLTSGILSRYIQDSFKGRVFHTTKTGHMGPSGLDQVKKDDKVCVINGCCSPLVIRAAPDNDSHDLIGEAYIHGLMDAEAIGMEGIEEVNITLH
jgi:hypothetical protein